MLSRLLIRWSHPSRGEWIEILPGTPSRSEDPRLTPRGVSGLKFVGRGADPGGAGLTPRGVSGVKSLDVAVVAKGLRGLTPRGVSGLKFRVGDHPHSVRTSHPSRGEWIEINSRCWACPALFVSPLAG